MLNFSLSNILQFSRACKIFFRSCGYEFLVFFETDFMLVYCCHYRFVHGAVMWLKIICAEHAKIG